jgi:hypothetical protein
LGKYWILTTIEEKKVMEPLATTLDGATKRVAGHVIVPLDILPDTPKAQAPSVLQLRVFCFDLTALRPELQFTILTIGIFTFYLGYGYLQELFFK